jgi:hypothetical protein
MSNEDFLVTVLRLKRKTDVRAVNPGLARCYLDHSGLSMWHSKAKSVIIIILRPYT